MKNVVRSIIVHAALAASVCSASASETIFIANDYAFDYASNSGAPDIVQSLCATRCNAISANVKSYMMPKGWRLIKIESNKHITVAIDNPYVKGNCICTGEVYGVLKDVPVPDSVTP